MWSARFFKRLDEARIVEAIRAAERETSGEIRVFVARGWTLDPVKAARRAFLRLGMDRTARGNGVLFFVCPGTRRFAVVGGGAVHAKCGAAFWESVAGGVRAHFREGRFTEGLAAGIEQAGALLGREFPREPGDVNEQPDGIARG